MALYQEFWRVALCLDPSCILSCIVQMDDAGSTIKGEQFDSFDEAKLALKRRLMVPEKVVNEVH